MTLESGGDPSALSPADAHGLMQVLHGPWDPSTNVFEGARLLADYYVEFGTWKLALAAYNAGPNAVTAFNGVPPYRETRDYVIVVTYLYDLYSHHSLSTRRELQYRKTLRDLRHFAKYRHKVPILAKIGNVADALSLLCLHYAENCATAPADRLFPTLDPFWPLGGSPDPLQRVEPLR
jgi:hypothetical protein